MTLTKPAAATGDAGFVTESVHVDVRPSEAVHLRRLTRFLVRVVVDSAGWFLGLVLALQVRSDFDVSPGQWSGLARGFVVVATAQLLWGAISGLYRRRWHIGSVAEAAALGLGAVFITTATTVWLLTYELGRPLPASVPLGGASIFLFTAIGARFLYRSLRERRLRAHHTRPERAVVIGAGWTGYELIRLLFNDPKSAIMPVAVLDNDPLRHALRPMGLRVEGRVNALAAAAERHGASTVIIACRSLAPEVIGPIARTAAECGLELIVYPSPFMATGEPLGQDWSTADSSASTRGQLGEGLDSPSGIDRTEITRSPRLLATATKRVIDLIGSTILIVLTAPVQVAFAIAVRLDSPGPSLFVQERVGLHGRTFRMFKFRSMVDGADTAVHRLHAVTVATTPEGDVSLRLDGDPRATRVGGFMRRWSLDELPNLWNVWKGEMSLVGPRPLVPYESDLLPVEARRRFEVRPGITGLAQINGRLDIPFSQRITWDLDYVDGFSLGNDIRIICSTPLAFLRDRGA